MIHSISQQIWKTQQRPQDWKWSVFSIIPKKGNAKECSNYRTTALISHASKVILKILQARLQQYENQEFPDVQAGFRKGRGTRNQIINIHWKKQENSRKVEVGCFYFIDYAKALDFRITTKCVDHTNSGRFFKRWKYQTTLPVSWETCMQVKKQKLEPDMKQQLDQNWERSLSRLNIVTLLI